MQPFDGIDILDFTQVIAGPLSTQLVASLGGNVVKVEPPRGDAMRSIQGGAQFSCFNLGGKRSLCIDLKTEEGQEAVRELAAKADVIVESFRPAVMGQFGLDYDSVVEFNEDIVYCSLSGFGPDGPYSDRPAFDSIMQAMSGIMSVVGHPDREPVRIPPPLIDHGTAANIAFLIASALLKKERTGEGEHIDIALFDVAVQWTGVLLAQYTDTGEHPKRAGSGSHGLAPSNLFYAAGDEPLYITVPHDGIFERLCRVIGREDLLDDERFETNDDRWEHRDVLNTAIQNTFEEYDRDELIERLTDHGVPAGPQYRLDELMDDRHVEHRDLLTTTENIESGDAITVARPPIRTKEGKPELGSRPPELGEHSRDILARLGYSEAEIDTLEETGVLGNPDA